MPRDAEEVRMNTTIPVQSVPSLQHLEPRTRRVLARILLVLLIALPCIALAAPPAWAPAHGWRRKNDPAYPGYSGRQWERDYGVSAGRCDRAEIGAVLGGVAGGVIGAQAGKDEQRAVAITLGTVIGAAIGAEIGRRMDKADRSCVGHALELAGPGQTVAWTNRNTGVAYQLTPAGSDTGLGEACRKFRLIATGSFGLSEGRAIACADRGGTWSLAPDARLGHR
jgi:surface antigen